MTKYLIAGAGIAGLEASKTIRKNDDNAKITLISSEKNPPYYRIKLTHALETDEDADDLKVEKDQFYKDNNIELILDCRIREIDYDLKKVICDDGREFSYDKLLLATGSSPFVPRFEGEMLEHMTAIRTIEDVEELRDAYPEIKKVLVVGGGLLGLEAAYSLNEEGFEVHVGEYSDQLLLRQLDKETAEILREKLLELGINVHLSATLKEAHGDKSIEYAILTDGSRLDCDAIIFSVGVRPNLSLAKDKLETNHGLIVNEKLETSRKDVWAAGDIVEIDGITMGLWTAAMEMGRIAGANMTGGDEEYSKPMLFTNLRISDIKIFSIGNREGELVRIDGPDASFAKFYFNEGILAGAILYDNTRPMYMLKKAYKAGMKKEEVLNNFSF